MAQAIVAHHPHSTNGHHLPLRSAANLADAVLEIASLRDRIKADSARERDLAHAVIAAMQAQGARMVSLPGLLAVLDYRRTLKIDAGLFIDALGKAALPALHVKAEEARRLMAGDDLGAISETLTTPTLSVRRVETSR